ncbi:MAG TPA: hypothetical protein VFQ43_01595 [Nitrososphaera sp.]|nr:hypothetical protein [Nitrososphaera sp.]
MLNKNTASKSRIASKSKNSQIKLIREAYSAIPDMQDGFKDVREYLFDLNEEAERQHRKGAPYGIKHGLTVSDAAKLFTVSRLLDGFQEPDKWTVDAITSIRPEVLYAQAYAKRFHKELTEWAGKYASPFEQVDYAELMKGVQS